MQVPSRWSNKIEDQILKFWVDNRIYEKWKLSLSKAPRFTYLDGPPYTTGSIHLGHAWGKAIRDAVMKFMRKTGHNVFDRPGFDMHGLPIEVKVEKALGIKTKKDVYTVGPEKFVEKARIFSIENMSKMVEDFKRLGVFMDWDNPYMTITNEYIESIWFLFKKAEEKGLLYEGVKVSYWCPRCQTVLSRNEIELAKYEAWYKPKIDRSIYVKFKTKDGRYLIIWTTTPWTLTFNLGVMVNPNETYCDVKVGDEIWILARNRVEELMKKWEIENYEILREYPGKNLEGLEYEHVFKEELGEILENIKKESPKALTVWVSEEYVTVEDGTGLVHAAPGCGPEDQEVGERYGVKPFNTVDEEGIIRDLPHFEGLRAKIDDPKFIEMVRSKGLLVAEEDIEHDYPHCWRCQSPVIFRPIKQYFIDVQKIKESVISDLEKTYWVDGLGKEAMINVVKTAPDWNVTRQRFWGTPLPVWKCENGHRIVISSKDELAKLAGRKFFNLYVIEKKSEYAKDLLEWYTGIYENEEIKSKEEILSKLQEERDKVLWVKGEIDDSFYEDLKSKGYFVLRYKGSNYNITRIYNYDLHKGFLDSLELRCPVCGAKMKREPDVLDVWIDSGSSSWAVFEHPKREFYPADFIIEGYDQLRGWFYSLAVAGKVAVNEVPYKAVYTTGFVLDITGMKMSKSLGNIVSPQDVISRYGADALRMYLITSVGPFKDIRYNEQDVKTRYENLNVLWNIHKYLIDYSEYLGINPVEFVPSELDIEEKWMLSRLHRTLKQIKEEMEKYRVYKAARLLESLWLDLSRVYIKLTREKLNEGSPEDKAKVLWTIYYSLINIINVGFLFVPFISEAIYQNLRQKFGLKEESIAFYDFPEISEDLINDELEESFKIFQELLEAGSRLREKIGVSLRWPLRALYVKENKEGVEERLKQFVDLIKKKLNVKEVVFGQLPDKFTIDEDYNFSIAYDEELTDELIKEGMVREINRRIQNLRKSLGLRRGENIVVVFEGDDYVLDAVKKFKDRLEKMTDSTIMFRDEIKALENVVKTKEFSLRGHNLKVYILNIEKYG